MKKVSQYLFCLFLCVQSAEWCYSQQPVEDNQGTKYDKKFNGIGPRVYNLPGPRSWQEILVDDYKEKEDFKDSITQALKFQQVLEDFKSTKNKGYIRNHYNPWPATEELRNRIVHQEQALGNNLLAAGILNEYAHESLLEGNIDHAVGLLVGGVNLLKTGSQELDYGVLVENLSSLYIIQKKYAEAASLHEQFLDHALRTKTKLDEANAWVKIAIVQAYKQDYKAAENSIIRKAIPIYNRLKEYNRKILAWQQLAEIYQMHHRHPEAQWFLIQARDLAKSKGLHDQAAEMEFMLASSKLVQENYAIAIKEFKNAAKLADKENNELLQLAISDALGEAYLRAGEYEDAKEELENYWHLRKKLFSLQSIL